MVMLEKSFEEVYKTAYSHGLEAIYALENVDVRSIRRIQEPLTKPEKKKVSKLKKEISQQLEFDFGPDFRSSIPPFFLDEPIQQLNLSKHAEKILLDHAKVRLRDLLAYDFKGIGQGHIEEIKEKLQDYIAGRDLELTKTVDFAAWIRSLFVGMPAKKVFVLLEEYDLGELIQITSAEKVEIRRLSSEKRREWIQEITVSSIREKVLELTAVFLRPWMNKRFGIARKEELHERLERISECPSLALKAFRFFGDHLFLLEEAEPGIFCSQASVAKDYRSVIKKALTYFYNQTISYTLSELANYLKREFAKDWIGFPEGFIEKVLRLTTCFRVRKQATGLVVKKA